MCHENYLRYLLETCDEIYIDTSSLMNTEPLQLFVKNAEDEFVKAGKTITVTNTVLSELKNHERFDSNSEKRESAMAGKEIVTLYSTIFAFEEGNLECSDSTVFADSDFLARLTRNKAKKSQLLITNDWKLSRDAYRINEQESNKGYRIMICYINYYGLVCRCECTRERESKISKGCVKSEPQKSIERKATTETIELVETCKWKKPVMIAGCIMGGVLMDQITMRYIKPLLQAY